MTRGRIAFIQHASWSIVSSGSVMARYGQYILSIEDMSNVANPPTNPPANPPANPHWSNKIYADFPANPPANPHWSNEIDANSPANPPANPHWSIFAKLVIGDCL